MQIYTCDVIIDLQSYLSRGFMSLPLSPPPFFFSGYTQTTVFSFKSTGSRPNYPIVEIKPLSQLVSERKKKRKDKSGALWSRIFRKTSGLRVFY